MSIFGSIISKVLGRTPPSPVTPAQAAPSAQTSGTTEGTSTVGTPSGGASAAAPSDNSMSQPGAEGWILPLVPFHFTLAQNIKRDTFEQAVGESQKTVLGFGGALAAPMTAFLYDWNMLPIGQLLWEKELESYKEFPPLRRPRPTWTR